LEIVCPANYQLQNTDRPFVKQQGWDAENFAGCLPLLTQIEHLVLGGLQLMSWEEHEHPDVAPAAGDAAYVLGDYFRGLQLKMPFTSPPTYRTQSDPSSTTSTT